MLILLRLIFGAAFLFYLATGWETGPTTAQKGDLANAFNLAVLLLLGLANAVVWAPYLGAKISGPITGVLTDGTYVERNNYLLRLVYWLQDRGHRRLTGWFSFLEGIHNPARPAAFVIGLKNAQPGSWLEKVFAREVFKFDNAQNCVQAYAALKRHGIDPGRHHNPEINIVLFSLERSAKPDPAKIAVPPAPAAPPPRRNARIRLFGGAPAPPPAETNPSANSPSEAASEADPIPALVSSRDAGRAVVEAGDGPPTARGSTTSRLLQKVGAFLRGE